MFQSPSNKTTTSFNFLGLSSEMRNIVYRHALCVQEGARPLRVQIPRYAALRVESLFYASCLEEGNIKVQIGKVGNV
jgi:hypothetical protein